MAIDKLFFGYMAIVGIVVGVALVAMPSIQNLAFKPYVWIVLAVVLFDVGAYLLGRRASGERLLMPSRMLGLFVGLGLMLAVPWLAGTPVRIF